MVSSKSEPFYFECVYNRHGRFEYRSALLHLPERGKSRMHIIRDMFGPGHSPLVSGAFFAHPIPGLRRFAAGLRLSKSAPGGFVYPTQKTAWN